MIDNSNMKEEFRAVYAREGGLQSGWGPVRATLTTALSDSPDSSAEEVPQHIVGVETRQITPWIPVPIRDIDAAL